MVEGKTRDQIAKEIGVGNGTVSAILKECRQIDLLREIALKIKDQGDTIESFAPLVRCREILRKIKGIPSDTAARGIEVESNETAQKGDEKFEFLIIAFEVFCFKQKLSIKEFIDLVNHLYSVTERFGVLLEQLPGYVERLKEEIEDINLKKQNALENYATTLESLDEFRANRPLFETNQKLREVANRSGKNCGSECHNRLFVGL